MEIASLSIQVASGEPERLRAFYRDVVQLTPEPEMGDGSFTLGPAGSFFVVDHSEVSGAAKERSRILIDLHVTDIDAEHARLEAAGVVFSRSKGVEFWGGVISTFQDPDGNTIQLIQHKPELASFPEEVSHAG